MSGESKERGGSRLRGIFVLLVFVIFSGLFIRSFLFTSFIVCGNSMRDTLRDGDRVLVNKFIYDLRQPRRGDVVVFADGEEGILVKRIIAQRGEVVEMQDGAVYINGAPLDEPYIDGQGSDDFEPLKVGASEVFVMGDNRQESNDSRDFGSVPISDVKGVAVFVIWPPNRLIGLD